MVNCATLPKKTHATEALPPLTTSSLPPVDSPAATLPVNVDPLGPFDPSDCLHHFSSNMHMTVWNTSTCQGPGFDLAELTCCLSTAINESFQSFEITRNVDENETLASFNFGVSALTTSDSPNTLIWYNWDYGTQFGGMLSDEDNMWDPDNCVNTPSDGSATVRAAAATGASARQSATGRPGNNKTSPPTSAALPETGCGILVYGDEG